MNAQAKKIQEAWREKNAMKKAFSSLVSSIKNKEEKK